MAVNNTEYTSILTQGLLSSLGRTEIEAGKIRITIDTHQFFIDLENERIEITDIEKSYTEEQIRNLFAPLNKIYLSSDTQKLMIYTDEWKVLNGITLTETDTADSDRSLWFSVSSDDVPRYDQDLRYNPHNKTLKTIHMYVGHNLKVSDLVVSQSVDGNGDRTIDFSLHDTDYGDIDEQAFPSEFDEDMNYGSLDPEDDEES